MSDLIVLDEAPQRPIRQSRPPQVVANSDLINLDDELVELDAPRHQGPTGSLTTADYDTLSDSEYLIKRWQIYIPSIYRVPRQAQVLSQEGTQFIDITALSPQAIGHFAYEVLVNGTDNKRRSETRNYRERVNEIIVTHTPTTLTVRNGGIPIPIEKKSVPIMFRNEVIGNELVYLPEIIFSMPRAGGNFSTTGKDIMGQNGQGAKITNAWSKRFSVTAANSDQGLIYRQTWTNNMNTRSEPIIERYKGESFVEISYDLDFELLKKMNRENNIEWPEEINCYTSEDFATIFKLCIQLSNGNKVPFVYNGVRIDYSDDVKFFELYIGKGHKTIKHQEDLNFTIQTKDGPKPWIGKASIIIADAPGKLVSFVNGGETINHGAHVKDLREMIFKAVVEIVKEDKDIKIAISKGDKDTDLSVKFDISSVSPYMSLFIKVDVPDPQFTDQWKNTLRLPVPKYKLTKAHLKGIDKWDAVRKIKEFIFKRLFAKYSKKNTTGGQRIDSEKVEDATEAGREEAYKCLGTICEGRSAKGYINKQRAICPTKCKYWGVCYIRGNFENLRDASSARLLKNEEVRMIMTMFRLEIDEVTGKGLDYRIPANRKRLRYGAMEIACDQDVDGFHIKGLLINFIEEYFPTLIDIGYVCFLETSLVRAWKNGNCLSFPTMDKFAIFWNSLSEQERSHYTIKYCKGLGSSSAIEQELDLKENRRVRVLYDANRQDSTSSIELAFKKSKGYSDLRKNWIANFLPIFETDTVDFITVSHFVKTQVILHAIDAACRTIAHSSDGFKESIRKVIYGIVTYFSETVKNLPRVENLANFVAGKYVYHHGATILMNIIVRQAANYPGSNNLPVIPQESNFGSRMENSEDAANPRYAHVGSVYWLHKVFMKEDRDIYTYRQIEGITCEPEKLYPTIPLHVVNWMRSIGTGWSSNIPSHDVRDVIVALKERLSGRAWPRIYPFFNKYKGKCFLANTKRGIRFITQGVWQYNPATDSVRITELPIGIIPKKYIMNLYELEKEKKLRKVISNSVDSIIDIEIIGCGGSFDPQKFSMTRTISLSNMVLLVDTVCQTHFGTEVQPRPKKFKDINEVLEVFYQHKLSGMLKRKEKKIIELQQKIDNLQRKITIISAIRPVVSEYKDWDDVQTDMWAAPYGFSSKDITMRLSEIRSVDLGKLVNDKNKLEESLNELQRTPLEQMWLEDLIAFEKVYCSHEKLRPKTLFDLEMREKEIDKTTEEIYLDLAIDDEDSLEDIDIVDHEVLAEITSITGREPSEEEETSLVSLEEELDEIAI